MATSFGGDVSRWLDSECAYPTSDGRPMGETDLHRSIMVALINALQRHFAGQRTYVSGNILLFYERGNRRRHVSPDVLVVRDKEQRNHENYLLWVEGRPPNLVIEVTSRTTRQEDLQTKFRLYRDVIRVAEYVLFDPLGEYLKPSLQGFRLEDGQYVPIEVIDGRLSSRELELDFVRDGEQLRIFDPVCDEWVLTSDEAHRDSEERLATAEQLRREAEQRRREAERRRREAEQRQREAELRQQDEAERRRQVEEQSRLDRQELERLRKLLAEQQMRRDDS